MHVDYFEPLPMWARLGLSGADPEPVVDPPADDPPADPDPDVEAGRKALALVRTQGVKTAITQLKDKDGKPKYAWQDVDTVYELIDKTAVEVDLDTGAVSGLGDQLDALAKSKPFLLKPVEQYSGPTGTPPGGGLSGGGEHRTTATDLAREHSGVYGPLSRLAGIPLQLGS